MVTEATRPPPRTSSLGLRRADRSLLRTPAVLLALPAAVFAYALMTSTSVVPGYALSAASAADGTIVAVGPYVALCAALEMNVLRAVWGRLIINRAWWHALTMRLTSTIAGGLLITASLYGLALLALPTWSWPGVFFPLLSAIGVAAWTGFGAAVGLASGRPVALPTALLVPYLLLTVPAGWEPLWLRHLNGVLFDCCSTSQIVDSRAVIASLSFLGALLIISVCVARIRLAPAQSRPWTAVAVIVATLGAALPLMASASALGAVPATERPVSELICRATVCLWPEDQRYATTNEQAWSRVREAWVVGLGLPLSPTLISPVDRPGSLSLTVASDNLDEAELSMAGLLPRAARSCLDDFGDEQQNRRLADLTYLLTAQLGLTATGDFGLDVSTPLPSVSSAATIWNTSTDCHR